MSVERTLLSHYHDVEIDDSALQRLESFVVGLRGEHSELPPQRRLLAAGLTTLLIAVCIAVAAVVINHASSSQNAAANSVASGPMTVTNTGPGLPERTGFIGVVNARGVVGLVRENDADDVAQRGAASIDSEARLDAARAHLTVVLALFDPQGSKVIGQWNPSGAKTVLQIICPHRDGIAFRVATTGRTGHRTPLQAAHNLARDLSLAGFGNAHTTWTTKAHTALSATLTNATITLHATGKPGGTWFITSGQRCTT